jgi:thioredoxin reductase
MDVYDVITVGGSYAGIAATLQLGRARRTVLVVDAGQRRNRFARHSHGFLGQDGQPGEVIAARGRAEVLAYPTVTWRDTRVEEIRSTGEGFLVRAAGGEFRSRRVILATGVLDELPPIPGVAERWGRSVFFCPYCDGYELQRGRIGVLASGAAPAHLAVLVSEWSAPGGTTLFLNGAFEPDAEQLAELEAHGVTVEREPVVALVGEPGETAVQLGDGRAMSVDAIFLHPTTRFATPFADQLGLELEMGRLGPIYKTDMVKETTVPGVFACGDVAIPVPAVALAVADGTRAGTAAHQSLVFRKS